MLPTLESEDVDTTADTGNATGDALITTVEECLSEALRIFQLSPSEDTEREITEESSICNIGSFTHEQPIGSGLSPGGTLSNHTFLDSTPRSFVNDQIISLGVGPDQITHDNDGMLLIDDTSLT